jgi:hypothetical protein
VIVRVRGGHVAASLEQCRKRLLRPDRHVNDVHAQQPAAELLVERLLERLALVVAEAALFALSTK